MEVTNEEPEQSSGLTQGDLAIAAYALAETYNSYLEQYDEEDFGELSKWSRQWTLYAQPFQSLMQS